MSDLYLSKNIVKKLKRTKDILISIEEFITKFKHDSLYEIKDIYYIDNKIYKSKLIYNKSIVFDVSIEDDLIIWDIYKDKPNFSIEEKKYYTQQYSANIIEGNQFIKKSMKNLDDNEIKELLTEVKDSKSIEVNYCLDSSQSNILNNFKYSYSNNQVISGAAGSGKTLVLNRLAYEAIKLNKKYIYITFTSTLKDKFKTFIDTISDNNQHCEICVYTYEEFLRNYIAPKLGINYEEYITFNECSIVTKKIVKGYDIEKYNFTNSDITRLVMSMGVNISIDDDELEKEYDNHEMLSNRLYKLSATKDIIISEEDKNFIFDIFEQINNYITSKMNKKLWGDLIHEINKLICSDKEYIDSDYIFIDEMQDMSQSEYKLLERVIKDSLFYKKKLIIVYDSNQRISYDGSTLKNLKNRVKYEPVELLNNYRNSYSICKLANYFIDDKDINKHIYEDLKVNINNNPVKILIENDIDHVVNTITNKFIPEKNLNIGVLAFGKSYEKYKKYFVDDFGKSKFIGIEYFNEEEIKGLEFTNLIIIDFMEPLTNRDTISLINIRRWYVGITRACENLLIHFANNKELELLINYIENNHKKMISKEYINNKELVIQYNNTEDAFEKFSNDLLVSLGDEQRNIILNNGKKLIKSYETSLKLDLLDEGVDLFYKADALESLINILEQIVDKDLEVYLDIIFAAIKINSKQIIDKYINKIPKKHHWKLIEFAEINNTNLLSYLLDENKINNNKKEILKLIGNKVYKLKQSGNFDDAIKEYYKERLFDKVIQFYEKNNENYDLISISLIGKSYLKLGYRQEAIKFFYDNNQDLEIVKIYELDEDIIKALDICIDCINKNKNLNNDVDINIIEKAVELALKVKNLEKIKILIELLIDLNEFKLDELNFEAYILSGELKYIINSIKYYYKKEKYKSVIRCFKKEEQTILINRKQYYDYIKMVIKSFQYIGDDYGLATLYFDLEEYDSALNLYFKLRHYDIVSLIYEMKKESLSENELIEWMKMYKNEIIESYKKQHKIHDAIIICEQINDITEGIKIAYKSQLYNAVIDLYEQNKSRYFKENNINKDLYNIISNAYYNEKLYNKAAEIQEYLDNIYYAILWYSMDDQYLKIVSLFETRFIDSGVNSKNGFLDIILNNIENKFISNDQIDKVIDIIIKSYKYLNNTTNILKIYLISENIKYCNEIIELYYKTKDYKNIKMYYKDKQIKKNYNCESLNYIYEALLYETDKKGDANIVLSNKNELLKILLTLLKKYQEKYKLYYQLQNCKLKEIVIKDQEYNIDLEKSIIKLDNVEISSKLKNTKLKDLIDLDKKDFDKLNIENYLIKDIIEDNFIKENNKLLNEIFDKLVLYKELYEGLEIYKILSTYKIIRNYIDESIKSKMKEIIYDFVNRKIYGFNIDELVDKGQLSYIIIDNKSIVYNSLDFLKENNLVAFNDYNKKNSYTLITKICESMQSALDRYDKIESKRINLKTEKEKDINKLNESITSIELDKNSKAKEFIKISDKLKKKKRELKQIQQKDTLSNVSEKEVKNLSDEIENLELKKKTLERLKNELKNKQKHTKYKIDDLKHQIKNIETDIKVFEKSRTKLYTDSYNFFKKYLILFLRYINTKEVNSILNSILEWKIKDNKENENLGIVVNDIICSFDGLNFSSYINKEVEKYKLKGDGVDTENQCTGSKEDEEQMESNLEEKDIIKRTLIGVVKKGILNDIKEEILEEITGISIDEIKQIKTIISMDESLLKMVLGV